MFLKAGVSSRMRDLGRQNGNQGLQNMAQCMDILPNIDVEDSAKYLARTWRFDWGDTDSEGGRKQARARPGNTHRLCLTVHQ